MGSESIITIIGSDEGLVSAKASECFQKMTVGTDQFSHETIDGQASDGDAAQQICYQVVQAIDTPSFFGDAKVIWLKGASFLGDSISGKSEAAEAGLESLKKCLEQGMPPNTKLLISASEFDKRRAFNKFLISVSSLQEFNKPDISRTGWEHEVTALIQTALKTRGLTIEHDAMDVFVHRVGESYRQIETEVEKIDLYLGPERRNITTEDIVCVTAQTRTGIVFEISRALETGQVKEYIKLVNFQLEQGEQAVSIIRAAIIPTLRNLLAAKILCDTYKLSPSGSFTEFARQVERLPAAGQQIIPRKKDGTLSMQPIYFASQKARRFPLGKLKQALEECFQADKSLVSSSLDEKLVLHRLAIILAS